MGPSQTRAGVRTRIIRVSSRNNDPRTRSTDVRTHISVGACIKAHTRANIGAFGSTHARTGGCKLSAGRSTVEPRVGAVDTRAEENGALRRERDIGGTGGYQLVARGWICADLCGCHQEAAGTFILVGL